MLKIFLQKMEICINIFVATGLLSKKIKRSRLMFIKRIANSISI